MDNKWNLIFEKSGIDTQYHDLLTELMINSDNSELSIELNVLTISLFKKLNLDNIEITLGESNEFFITDVEVEASVKELAVTGVDITLLLAHRIVEKVAEEFNEKLKDATIFKIERLIENYTMEEVGNKILYKITSKCIIR